MVTRCFSSLVCNFFYQIVCHMRILLDNFHQFRLLMWPSMCSWSYFSLLPLLLSVLDGVQIFVIKISCATIYLAILMGFQYTNHIVSGSIWKGQGSPCIHAYCSTVAISYDMLPAAKHIVLQRLGGGGIRRCCMFFYHLQGTAWCWSSCVANLLAYHHSSSSLSLCMLRTLNMVSNISPGWAFCICQRSWEVRALFVLFSTTLTSFTVGWHKQCFCKVLKRCYSKCLNTCIHNDWYWIGKLCLLYFVDDSYTSHRLNVDSIFHVMLSVLVQILPASWYSIGYQCTWLLQHHFMKA